MFYNVAQLLKEPTGASRQYSVNESVPFSEEGWGLVHPTGPVSMLRTPRGILVSAGLTVSIPEPCGRCLETFQELVTAEIEEEFFPMTDVNTGLPLEVPRDSEPLSIDAKHILDLTEALRQAILLARPIQSLCRPDCAGLCVSCGCNLNWDRCDCSAEPSDPRWAPLGAMVRPARGG